MNDVVIEILGSGGQTPIPRTLCKCRICQEAREKGFPYKRTGPSVFIHGPNILIDTPEESSDQLERAGITHVDAGFYSHWHPDHTLGCRVWQMNKTLRHEEGRTQKTTPIYLPENIIDGFKQYYGLMEHFGVYDRIGYTKTHIVPLDQKIDFGDVAITPFQMAETFVTGFELQYRDKKALIIMDETLGWHPAPYQIGYDVVMMPIGVVEFHPLTGKRLIREGHGILKGEPTFEKVLDIVRELKAKKVILAHIGEGDQLSYDELLQIQDNLNKEGLPVEFAYDGLKFHL